MKCHKFSSKFFLENSFLRPNCKVENIFWPSVCSTLLIYSKASKQSPWFTKIVKVLVLKNKLLHLHFHRGHFLPNSYTVFGETSKEFFHRILSSSFVNWDHRLFANLAIAGYSFLSRLALKGSIRDSELLLNLKKGKSAFYWSDIWTSPQELLCSTMALHERSSKCIISVMPSSFWTHSELLWAICR